MLSKDILDALKSYTQNMQSELTLVLKTGEHSKRGELKEFLSSLVSVSDLLKLEERDEPSLRSSVSFALEVDGKFNGIEFSGIPSGHEFNSLVLAILRSTGASEIKLDDSLKSLIAGVSEKLHFEVFVSLSCHNCPEVVQALDQFALLNDNISVEMIDGGVFPALIAERDIQGVPSVYLNGELFANGKVEPANLIDKLLEKNPEIVDSGEVESLPLQDVTIIGGGPAGVASAIYSARKGLNVTLVADRLGGQVKDTMGIENLISVPKTTGPELTSNLQQHLNDYDVNLKEHLRVTNIEKGRIKSVTLSSGEVIQTKTIIIASGAKWRELGVPGEKEYVGNGVAYCPHCDGPFYKGKDVAVVGGGNSGIEAAIDLAGIVKSVTVFEFLPELKADQVLIDQAQARSNITILKNVATKEIVATDGKVSSIKYEDRDSGDEHSLDLKGVFVQIGLIPNSDFLKGVVETSKYGEIIINERCETSEDGIFAAGDVTTVPYKQIVIAMGEGSTAALSAFDYLIKSFPVEEETEESDSQVA